MVGDGRADFQRLFEAAPGRYLVLDPALCILAASDAYLDAAMITRAAMVGRHIFDVFPDNPEDVGATGTSNLRSSLNRVLKERRPDAMAVQRYDIRRPGDGVFEQRYWSPFNTPVLGSSGEVDYIIHRVEDVTEFVQLKERQAAAGELRRQDEVEAEVYRRAQQVQDANAELRQLRAELERRVLERTAELEHKNHELSKEIAERQRAETALASAAEQLRQAQKLEAVGRLAGGIAHDFNNLLSVILTVSSMVLESDELPANLKGEILDLQRAGERAAELTRQMLAFSRQQVLEPRNIDLNELIHNLDKMLHRILGEDVQIRELLSPDLGTVSADPGQIEQVIMNLVINARDAMPEGGTLSVETSNCDLDEAYANEHLGVVPGPFVLLSVSDSGVGMTRDVLDKIFDPFFTTKPKGKGTGLGLSTVFGIVKQSGGHLWAYSERGRGSTFKVYLPRVDRQKQSLAARPAPQTYHGTETVLWVEDDAAVRAAAARILSRAGYQVIEAGSPSQAVGIFEQRWREIHLVLSDVIMPEMSGRRLRDVLVGIAPQLKILFMSGYTENAALHDGSLDAGFHFIQKPLTPQALSKKVREVLESGSAL